MARGMRESQNVVLQLFVKHGNMTDKAMLQKAGEYKVPQSSSGLRTRRNELVKQGRLERKGTWDAKGGRREILWGLV
ncbi:unnamed protein product [marine sediment metagenome]|uniref:LexA repressor DNA-binding domain-containing protein n=1 Tax=marine sediment metagenome TaxID=412755 RepID=X0XLG5_9ZZZZ